MTSLPNKYGKYLFIALLLSVVLMPFKETAAADGKAKVAGPSAADLAEAKTWIEAHPKQKKKCDLNGDGVLDDKELRTAYPRWRKNHPKGADLDNNPPGPKGGKGTNWENPPGPKGGPGASPNRKKKLDKDNNPPGPKGGKGTNWENPPGPKGGPGASPNKHKKK